MKKEIKASSDQNKETSFNDHELKNIIGGGGLPYHVPDEDAILYGRPF